MLRHPTLKVPLTQHALRSISPSLASPLLNNTLLIHLVPLTHPPALQPQASKDMDAEMSGTTEPSNLVSPLDRTASGNPTSGNPTAPSITANCCSPAGGSPDVTPSHLNSAGLDGCCGSASPNAPSTASVKAAGLPTAAELSHSYCCGLTLSKLCHVYVVSGRVSSTQELGSLGFCGRGRGVLVVSVLVYVRVRQRFLGMCSPGSAYWCCAFRTHEVLLLSV